MNDIPQLLRSKAQGLRNAALEAALTGGGKLPGLPWEGRALAADLGPDALSGRTVLVTGASSGIGRVVALKVGAAGGRVVLVARSLDKLLELQGEIERAGGRAAPYEADLSSKDSTEAFLARLAADGVVVDVLINNAGRSIRRSIADSAGRVHDYERTMALNYLGAVRLILGLLPGMRARQRGHVVNVSSAGVQMSTPLFSAYIASKAALDAFARVAAVEAREDGVCFTTVHMPLVRTPMIAPTPEYQNVPALSPDEAAEMVLRSLVTREAELGTRLAKLVGIGHVVAPELTGRLLGLGRRWLAHRHRDQNGSSRLHVRASSGDARLG
jgi:short-subunit dehydrogenase